MKEPKEIEVNFSCLAELEPRTIVASSYEEFSNKMEELLDELQDEAHSFIDDYLAGDIHSFNPKYDDVEWEEDDD